MMKCLLVAVFLLTVFVASPPEASAAPSFDCARAASEVETLICADAELSDLDRQLADRYGAAVNGSGKMREGVIALQRSWLSRRATECTEEAGKTECLRALYRLRLDGLTTGALDQAFLIMVRDPKTAEKVFRLDDSERAKMGLAVVLRLFFPEKESEVAPLLKQIAGGEQPGFELRDYDGSVEGLADYMVAAQAGELPCALFERFPALVEVLEPRFFSSRDNFLPRTVCAAPEYRLPASLRAFRSAVYNYAGDAFDRCTGTMRFGFARRDLYDGVVTTVLPRKLLERSNVPAMDEFPLRRWSYHTLANWHAYQDTRKLFLQARADLAAYYRQRFGLPEADALRAAHIGVWNGLESWTRNAQPIPGPVRVAFLDADARPSLREWMANASPDVLTTAADVKDDPPLLLLVERPELLSALLSLHPDVNATNAFGKTALMTAAQFDQLETVRLLLGSGASIDAVSLAPDQIPGNDPEVEGQQWSGCGYFAISHGSRTALMYAAANASLPVIEALLAAGADKRLADSQGSTALDYLTGKGPVGANPRLAGAELEKAKALLVP